MQRTSKWLPKLRKIMKNDLTSFNLKLPTETEAVAGAAHGLADILEYYDMNATKMALGVIEDFRFAPDEGRRFYKAASNLTSSDLVHIALAAKKANYLDGCVAWAKAALMAAKAERKPSKYIAPIK